MPTRRQITAVGATIWSPWVARGRYAALVMYEVPASPDTRPGCRDSLFITRVIFAIVVPPVAMMTAVLLLALATIVTFTISPPWALIPLALLVLVIVLFVRWARTRPAGAETTEF